MWDPYAGFETIVLPNGLSLYVNHWPGRPFVDVRFIVHSGSVADLPGKEGTAHFLEHLVTRNSSQEQEEFERYIESEGGSASFGSTSFFATRYAFFSSLEPDVLARAFDYFGSVLMGVHITHWVEHEREVIRGEIRRRFPTQLDLSEYMTNFEGLFGKGHRFSVAPNMGTFSSLDVITPEDLQDFYDHHYTPANISVVVVGGLSISEVVQLISASPLAGSKSGERSMFARESTAPLPTTRENRKSVREVTGQETDRAMFTMQALVPGTFDGQHLSVFRDLLYDVLFERVRKERHWAYDIGVRGEDFISYRLCSIAIPGLFLEGLDHIEAIVYDSLDAVTADRSAFERNVHRRIRRIRDYDATSREVAGDASQSLIVGEPIRSLKESEERLARIEFESMTTIRGALSPERFRFIILEP